MLGRGVWIPALLSCSGSVLVRVGARTLMLQVGLAAGACGLEFARAVCSSVRVCCVLLHAARSSAACFLLFCLVLCCTQLVFSLAACFHVCHVLCEHAAYEFSH